MNTRKFVACTLAGASLAVLAHPALAQDSATDQPAPASQPTPEETDAIVVTGSRVITNGNNSPTPVTVISQETLQNVRPTTISDGLNSLPVFAGSRGQLSNPSATGGVGAGNGAASQLNLRNIGSQRNLVLLDGRRVQPTSNTNIVDVDMIPQALVKRVDMVTGGVSAVYGSDAVTGVINFVTDTNFNGVKAHAQYGISEYGDGGAFNAGVTAGTELFGGRGHIEASYEYRDDKGVLRRSDRPWWNENGVVGNGGTAPYELLGDLRLSAFPFGGRITCGASCALNGQYFASNGVLSPFVNGTATSTNGVQVGGAGGYQDMSLKSPLKSHQFYGRFDFDVTDDVHFFASVAGNIKTNTYFADTFRLTNATLSSTNAFLAPQYQAALAAAGVSSFTLSKLDAAGPRFNPEAKSNQYLVTTGLDGSLGGAKWNVAYSHGYSRLKTVLHDDVNNQHLAAALDAVVDPGTGNIVCSASLTDPTHYGDCVPLDPFGPTSTSQAAYNYVMGDVTYVANTYQDDVVADISGSPISTWAGPVNVALSGEWRRQSFNATSNGAPDDLADCTGLSANCTQGKTGLWAQTFPSSPSVHQSVWEAAVEANVPLLKDVPLVQSFDLNGAARYTKYDTVGDYWTWKIGADWHVNDDLRFRGTISRDIRAPTLNDLYAPESVVTVQFTDLQTGNSPTVPSINYGNQNLTAEIGKTKTVGFVYKPHYLPGWSLAVDYYNIEISNAITTVQGFNAGYQQECIDDPSSPYCALQVRDSSGNITAWLVTVINIADIKTEGVDVELDYHGNFLGHPLMLRGLAAYQPHVKFSQPGTVTVDQGGVAFGTTGRTASPTWRLTGIASYQLTDNFRVDLQEVWRNGMKLWASGDWVSNHVRPFGVTSINLNWKIPDEHLGGAEFFLNVNNVFDANPPPANGANSATGVGGFNGFVATDDAIGRYWTAGFRVKF